MKKYYLVLSFLILIPVAVPLIAEEADEEWAEVMQPAGTETEQGQESPKDITASVEPVPDAKDVVLLKKPQDTVVRPPQPGTSPRPLVNLENQRANVRITDVEQRVSSLERRIREIDDRLRQLNREVDELDRLVR